MVQYINIELTYLTLISIEIIYNRKFHHDIAITHDICLLTKSVIISSVFKYERLRIQNNKRDVRNVVLQIK